MWKCLQCQQEVDDNLSVCSSCGTPHHELPSADATSGSVAVAAPPEAATATAAPTTAVVLEAAKVLPRAMIEGSVQLIWEGPYAGYTAFQELVRRPELQAPGLGRLIAVITRSQSGQMNHRAMALLFVARKLLNLAGGQRHAEILGYQLDVFAEPELARRKIATFDMLVRFRPGHEGPDALPPGLYLTTVSYGEERDKRKETYEQTMEHRRAIAALRERGFLVTGHFIVRAGPDLKDRFRGVRQRDGLTLALVRCNVPVTARVRNVTAAPPDADWIDQLQQGTATTIETIFQQAGAVEQSSGWQLSQQLFTVRRSLGHRLWRALLRVRLVPRRSQRARAAAVQDLLLQLTRPQVVALLDLFAQHDSTTDAEAYQTQLDEQVPEQLRDRDRLIRFFRQQENTTSWRAFYELIADLPLDAHTVNRLWTNFATKMMNELLRGAVTRRKMRRFIRRIHALRLIQMLWTQADDRDNEIVQHYFSDRSSPEWIDQAAQLWRARWVKKRLERRARKIQKRKPWQ